MLPKTRMLSPAEAGRAPPPPPCAPGGGRAAHARRRGAGAGAAGGRPADPWVLPKIHARRGFLIANATQWKSAGAAVFAAGFAAAPAAVLAGPRRFCRAPVLIFVSVDALGSTIPILCNSPNADITARIMPPAAARQARILRESVDSQSQEYRRVLIRGAVGIQGRRAARDPARAAATALRMQEGHARGRHAGTPLRRGGCTPRRRPHAEARGARARGREEDGRRMPAITRRLCGPAELGKEYMRHTSSAARRPPLPGPGARQAACAQRRVPGQDVPNGHVVPAPGDGAGCKRPRGAPIP